MKNKYIVISLASLLPLAAVGVLSLFGVIFSFGVYLLLAVICPLEAGILWFMYKDMEKKVAEAKKEAEKQGRR